MKYSQNNEQDIILNYFGNKQNINWLSIGENDGITFSNVYQLYLLGHRGANIEPSPKAFKRLQQNQPHSENNNIALSTYDGTIILHESGELIGAGDVALVSSTKRSELSRWRSLNMPFTEIEVPCLTFKSFLRLSSYKTFDFVSVDIEGMELEVLPQMDFTKLGTKLICVEWNSKDERLYNKILNPFGFRTIHKNLENLIYCR